MVDRETIDILLVDDNQERLKTLSERLEDTFEGEINSTSS